MKTLFNKPLSVGFFTIVICFFSFVITGCDKCFGKKHKNWRDRIEVKNGNELGPDSTQLIVWRKPEATDEEFSKWLDTMGKAKGVTISFFCKSCDSTIMLLTGPGAEAYASGVTPKGGSTTPTAPPSGDDGPVMYSLNYQIEIPKVSDTTPYNDQQLKTAIKFEPHSTPDDTVIVAVIDTGLDTMIYKPQLYKGFTTSCLGVDAVNGWNFALNNKDWKDDHDQRHGTVVTHFIVDQVNKYGKNAIKILPIKIHDQKGVTNLFKILCAFAYAKDRGANIVNASFGFYVARNPATAPGKIDAGAYLLREFVKRNLTDNKILLIAAAGNVDDAHEDLVFKPAVDGRAKRNLDSVSFYPASLSRELNNVIPVTTIFKGRVSPFQNYSPSVVYLAANADVVVGDMQLFANPLINGNTLNGSSFATPIVAGKICAHYRFLNNGTISRENILTKLSGITVVERAPIAVDTVFNGYFTRKQ